MQRKLFLASGIALALGGYGNVASAATGLQLDPTGSGSIAGSEIFQDAGGTGNMLANKLMPLGGGGQPVAGLVDGSNLYVAQSVATTSGGGRITYQFILPVTSASNAGNAEFIDRDANADTIIGNDGVFKLFFDPTPSLSPSTGLGYGDLNGSDPGDVNADQVELASGTLKIDPGLGVISFNRSSNTKFTFLSDNDHTVATIRGSGSGSVLVDFTTKNDSYVVNDLTGLTLDLSVLSLGPQAPFTTGVESGSSVVGATADYGTGTTLMTGANADAGLVGLSLVTNDFGCKGFGSAPCDMQYQVSGSLNFAAQTVPEPASLALLGLGLGLMGFSIRRSRRRRAATRS